MQLFPGKKRNKSKKCTTKALSCLSCCTFSVIRESASRFRLNCSWNRHSCCNPDPVEGQEHSCYIAQLLSNKKIICVAWKRCSVLRDRSMLGESQLAAFDIFLKLTHIKSYFISCSSKLGPRWQKTYFEFCIFEVF